MLWLAFGPLPAMENQVLVIRIKIPNRGAVDWTVNSGPQLLFRDVLVSVHLGARAPARGGAGLPSGPRLPPSPAPVPWPSTGQFYCFTPSTDELCGLKPGK